MSKYYVIDEIGNKYESMTKTEILQSIGAGGERENVFTGDLIYDNERIDYTYTGEKPTDDIILKLLDAGLKLEDTHLTDIEIMTIAALNDFTIHYYYTDGELYVSNRNDNSIKFFKEGIGVMTLYPNSREVSYYMKSNKKMNDVRYCQSKKEFDDIVKDEDTTYIVEDENYTVDRAIASDYTDSIFDTTAFYDIRDYEDEQTRHSAFNLSKVFDKSGNVYLPKVKNATKADKADVSVIPQAITGETKFYPIDQDTDYMDIEEPNFTFSEVFEKSESDTNKYLPRVKEATNAIHCNTANDANYAVAADSLYVEQNESASVQIVNGGTVTTNGITSVLNNVNQPAIIHFNLDVQLKAVSGLSTAKTMHSESLFYNGTIRTGKLCPVAIIDESTQKIYKILHIIICYDNSLNKWID